jgi:hypothetical protein
MPVMMVHELWYGKCAWWKWEKGRWHRQASKPGLEGPALETFSLFENFEERA